MPEETQYKLLLKCSHCEKEQLYVPRERPKGKNPFVGKRRKCVSCGKSFKIYKNKKNNNIVKIYGKANNVKPDKDKKIIFKKASDLKRGNRNYFE